VCSFNPIYGQGMTAAALEGAALAECLAQGRASLAQRFFAKAAKIIDTPWQIAAGNDLRHPRLRQHQSTIGRFMNWYIMPISGLCRADVRSRGQVCNLGAACRHNQSASRKASSVSPGR
jgi:hypothetical protein